MNVLSRRSQGFSLIELLLVLGVLVVVTGAAFAVYTSNVKSRQTNAELQNALAIMANMETKFGRRTAGVSNAIANQARVFPASMNSGNFSASAPIRSAWGTPVRISTTGAAAYDLIYEGVSPEMCVKFLPQVVASFPWVQVQKGATGGSGQVWLRNPSHSPGLPSTTKILETCSNSGDPFLIAISNR